VRIGIVGTGWVGSSIAISTLQSGIANERLLSDARSDVAEGEAMDLAHGASLYPAAREGVLGLRDVALSLPSVVGTAGAVEVLEPELEAGEREALLRSAGVLSEAWETL
jgi:L-lactate dehydrogenase